MLNVLSPTETSVALFLLAGLLSVIISYICIKKDKPRWLIWAVLPFFLLSYQQQKSEEEALQFAERYWIQGTFETYEPTDLTIHLESKSGDKRVYAVETDGGAYQAVFNEDSSMFQLVFVSGENLNGRLQVLSALHSLGLSETNLSYISDKEYVATGLGEEETYSISLNNHLVMAVVNSYGDILLQNEDDNDTYAEKADKQAVEASPETNEESEVKE